MRSDIEMFLEVAAEASAKTIANRTGLPQEEVAKEMHHMHADGIVEREKRKGGGNEYVHWLARGNQPGPAAKDLVSTGLPPSPTEAMAKAPTAAPISDMAAFERLAGQTRELLDTLGLPSTMTEAIAAARTMQEVAEATSIERDELKAESESNKVAAARWKLNCAELEARIDDLTLGAPGSKSPLFVTIGRNSEPQRHSSLETAQRRGQSLVRSKKESEVLVLEPVGRIVVGTEWRPR